MKGYTIDARMNTVMSAWNNIYLDGGINIVFDRICCVLTLTNEGNGENDLVKTKRDVVYADIKFDFI